MSGTFNRELRDQLRDQLLETLEVAFRIHFVKALETTAISLISERMTETVDQFLQEFLNDDDLNCWLSFEDGQPRILVGIGPGHCAASFRPTLFNDPYRTTGGPISKAQCLELSERVATMTAFIDTLIANRTDLQTQIAAYEARHVPVLS